MIAPKRSTIGSLALARFLAVIALLVILSTALTFEGVLMKLRPRDVFTGDVRAYLAQSRVVLISLAIGLALLSAIVKRVAFARHRIVQRALITVVMLIVPLVCAERLLCGLLQPRSEIFLEDAELGWRLRPGAQSSWCGVPVRINSKGLRGPERDYEAAAGVERVLVLGDSIVFGFLIEDEDEVLPARLEVRLERDLGPSVECINAGVGGYSPWQEHRWLTTEGVRYEPDLLVLGFVLNDVTEKLDLKRFGGEGHGFQLDHGAEGRDLGPIAGSNIMHFIRRLRGYLKFGPDIQKGAERAERLGISNLMRNPQDPRVEEAWRLTQQHLEGIVRFCAERHLPLLVVAFPASTQLEQPELDAPQRRLERLCGEWRAPFLDCLPPLRTRMAELDLAVEDVMLDEIHFSPLGCELLGDLIGSRILAEGLL